MIKEKVRPYIVKNLTVFDDEVEILDTDDIFNLGFVNSLFAMELVGFIEQEFNITIETEDMEISNFNTINNIESLIEKKQGMLG
ncbi:acyl carrier protein [Virgibacillus pantothenticus]|uniref:acyl carrier protein n=1 Tax=Virgibacillus pantothenticus TaxID=1473 RepID=UPI001C21B1DE|nr:acyl carrier protein [Virgibacillus pantothenticus]MBU8567946.1 acyl carrier protein [Virgibacillus pantothenticus]MBU8601797.1 acyl carrier protein [Virgibacillus pantothenticus]MBU8635951.1 acyl carrier protein [Virgibacillus pantothenticus]MBU8643635.1 acyl carrier protein [Virgibacillus pantothenticus]MBU8647775.1 acyl carrier protein [Virgibacillus pantothenticus]